MSNGKGGDTSSIELKKEEFKKECPVCMDIPRIPKIIPCQHVYCLECIEKLVQKSEKDRVQLLCSMCRMPFLVLPQPEVGCKPVGNIKQEFEVSNYFQKPVIESVITDCSRKVMGMACLHNCLYVVYHKDQSVYIYDCVDPYQRIDTIPISDMKWPRGLAASQTHSCILITDWDKMFSGTLWKLAATGKFHKVSTLDVQPFGVSVTIGNKALVTCSTPLRTLTPLSKSNKIVIFDIETDLLERTILLPDNLEIPRYAIQLYNSDDYVVCYGWNKQCGQVKRFDTEGKPLDGVYGSTSKEGEQNLGKPLSLHEDDKQGIFIVDYYNHRIQMLSYNLQLVRHIITVDDGIKYPRHVCLDSKNGRLYIGQDDGQILVYIVWSTNI